jgi:uncharacterized protein
VKNLSLSVDYENPVFNIARPKDAYRFFLDMGSVKHTNKPVYFNNKGKIWNEYITHDTYDAYWKARNIRPHLKNLQPAVLVVGGWFDAEDLFGALYTYEAIEQQTRANNNRLVMGPWTHGAWGSPDWSKYATHQFGSNTSKYYKDEIETVFFNYYLKGIGTMNLPEATVFETGTNRWKQYDSWPPRNMQPVNYFLGAKGILSTAKPRSANGNKEGFDEYLSDPAKPVPYVNIISGGRVNEYMAEDQRFAAMRPDVLVFSTDTLTEDITLSGRILAKLLVSTTGTDADFVVKLIDVLPDHTPNPSPNTKGIQMGGYQRLVRAEVMRGKFRNSFEKPQPFVPGRIAEVNYELPDVAHTFLKGHRIMIQVQSSWFPLVDRNPQQFMRIPDANDTDFKKATIRLYHDGVNNSMVVLPVLGR